MVLVEICGVALFTDLLNMLLLFFSLSRHFLPLAPSVSPRSTGELVVAGSGVGDLDGDDYRIVGLLHVFVRGNQTSAQNWALAQTEDDDAFGCEFLFVCLWDGFVGKGDDGLELMREGLDLGIWQGRGDRRWRCCGGGRQRGEEGEDGLGGIIQKEKKNPFMNVDNEWQRGDGTIQKNKKIIFYECRRCVEMEPSRRKKKLIKINYFNKIDKNLDNRMEDNFESD